MSHTESKRNGCGDWMLLCHAIRCTSTISRYNPNRKSCRSVRFCKCQKSKTWGINRACKCYSLLILVLRTSSSGSLNRLPVPPGEEDLGECVAASSSASIINVPYASVWRFWRLTLRFKSCPKCSTADVMLSCVVVLLVVAASRLIISAGSTRLPTHSVFLRCKLMSNWQKDRDRLCLSKQKRSIC